MMSPRKVACICGDESCTYAELFSRVQARSKELHVEGRIVPFRAAPSIDTLINYFAIHEARGIAAPLDKSLSDNLFDATPFPSDVGLTADMADLLFTTGTTGKPKGVLIPHRALLANAENLLEAHRYHPDLTFVVNGPLNHLGSLSKIYPSLYVGATIHLIDGLKDLDAFFAAFNPSPALSTNRYATFLVPAHIRMLLAFARKALAKLAESMEFIETGAAPISQKDMEELGKILPHTRLYNTYASTETGIISTYLFNPADCTPDCVGKPMRHSMVTITPEGTVACGGTTLMAGYIDDYDPLSPPPSIICTSDRGAIDVLGRLHLKGRNDDVINVGGFKVNPLEVEDVALSYTGVSDCACVSSENPLLGTVLKLLVVADPTLDRRALAQYMKLRLETYKVPSIILHTDSIPRNRLGKIDRKGLSSKNASRPD